MTTVGNYQVRMRKCEKRLVNDEELAEIKIDLNPNFIKDDYLESLGR